MEIIIRVATSADVPILQKLIPESARALCNNYYTPQQIDHDTAACTYEKPIGKDKCQTI